jgi:prefoldin subunit 5
MVDRTQLQRLAQEVETLRKRLEEINLRIEQVDVVLAEHTITDAVLETLLGHDAGASISTHLPIGSGVSLPYRHQDSQEGTALVDLGAGVFGERSWSDVRALTQQRQADIQHLRDELKQQSDQTETSLGQAAQSFNLLAEQLKQPSPAASTGTPAIVEPTPADEGNEEPTSEPQNRRSRRRGMFGGDLTLDD